MVSIQELRLHLSGLISDRKELSSELESLKDSLKEGRPAKRRSLNDKSWRDADEEKEQVREKIKKVEQEIEFRSSQITEIQERLMDTDQGTFEIRYTYRLTFFIHVPGIHLPFTPL